MATSAVASDATTIYFSDVFGVAPEVLEAYGAFDVSLVNDLPLFIDPFLLFHSGKPEYQVLHEDMIAYLRFLRDKSVAGPLTDGQLLQWFMFREVKQTWLGYSLVGNKGSGLGRDFAVALNRNLEKVFADFGQEHVTKGSHLERLCLIDHGVGRDSVSDFTTNLIKSYLLDYTQAFARAHLHPEQRRVVPVPKARFDFATEVWVTERYELPFADGDHVLLTPFDMLTKDDIWINRTDLVRDYEQVAASVPNEQLRAQLGGYFARALGRIQARDEEARRRARSEEAEQRARRRRVVADDSADPTKKQREEATAATIAQFPEVIDHYIRYKEDRGDDAEAQADERVRSSERLYIAQVRELVETLRQQTGFYGVPGTTRDEAMARVQYLKDVIENKGGHRLFYADGEPIRRESDLHIIFRLTWINTPSDVNREVNNGRGPSDFEVSRGRFDKTLVEFKLAGNSKLRQNLAAQAEIYQKASDARHALKVIVFFTREEQVRVQAVLKDLGLDGSADVVLIDARGDNKPSASKATSPSLEL